MMQAKKDTRVIIVGGGPGGILAAANLKKKGYNNVEILEKRPNQEKEGRFGKTYSYKLKETFDFPNEVGTW